MTGPLLHVKPCLPVGWPGYTLEYRYRRTRYHIEVKQGESDNGEFGVVVDGQAQSGMVVPLIDDLQAHEVSVLLRSERQLTPA